MIPFQTVITQWYEGSREIVETIERNYTLADEMARTLAEDFDRVEGEEEAALCNLQCGHQRSIFTLKIKLSICKF